MMDNRELQPISINPESITDSILDELLCRFIINLPDHEKEPPRIFVNIKVACWFYADNYCSIAPVV